MWQNTRCKAPPPLFVCVWVPEIAALKRFFDFLNILFIPLAFFVGAGQAKELFEPGDVILFNTDNFLCRIQRAVTFSSFDHVGVIVRKRILNTTDGTSSMSKQMYLFESTGDGAFFCLVSLRLIHFSLSFGLLVFVHFFFFVFLRRHFSSALNSSSFFLFLNASSLFLFFFLFLFLFRSAHVSIDVAIGRLVAQQHHVALPSPQCRAHRRNAAQNGRFC